jgi:nucleoid-associated protein YgaU
MGKETKVGLAVIAVLMTVFGVLLFRHLQASHELPSRGLGDQTAVKPLPTHGDVTVASDESRITGSKLWDSPAANDAAKAVEVAAGEAVDPYEAQPAKPQSDVVVAGGLRQSGNPLRQASAEVPVEASEEPIDAAGDEVVTDPLMTVPDSTEPAIDDPYAGQATEIAPAEEPLPADNAFEAPVPAAAPRSAALRNPFGQAAPVEAAPEPAANSAAGAPEPAWTEPEPPGAEPQNEFDPQVPNEPATASEPQQPGTQFDRFESSPTAESTPAVSGDAAPTDDWRTSTPAAAPLAADASEATPLPIENGMYTVQPGDSLWTVSEAVYGTGGYFKALAAHNRAVLPKSDKLTVGNQLSVPPMEDLQRDYPSLCPRPRKSAVVKAGATRASAVPPRSGRDVYIVNQGDTLFTIARYELGKATRWAEIYDLNRDALGEDYDHLRPGMELVMPARGAEAAAQPASRY